MNYNASKVSCDFILNPTDEKYSESERHFQGCPTIAITRGGRIFLGWYSGGTREPHMDNYNLLVYSDDKGKTWSKPVLVIPSNKKKFIHALDIQLWTSPEGKLYIFWVQNNTDLDTNPRPVLKENQPWVKVDGYQFPDFVHSQWMCVCDNPDADKLEFSKPRYIDKGFLRCKPTVLGSGRWLLFNYDQESEQYGYSISDDKGKTFVHRYGAKKISTYFDESMAYVKNDGSIRMFARTNEHYIGESASFDNGETWTDAVLTDIPNPNTRFYVAKTPSGNVLFVNNDDTDSRTNMTIYLSEDDGITWKYKRCIDERALLSYPDVDFCDGEIFLTYDRDRDNEREILFVRFTEEDIKNPEYKFEIQTVSKA